MTLAEKLVFELERIAPDWAWECEEKRSDSPVLIELVKVEVSARNKDSGVKTIPIQVGSLNQANISETSRFICEILLIETPGGAKAKALLVES